MMLRAEEQSQQLQLVEREDIEDEEDLFEAIDKCKLPHWPSLPFTFRLRTSILDFYRFNSVLV